jgi:hypothetical protein
MSKLLQHRASIPLIFHSVALNGVASASNNCQIPGWKAMFWNEANIPRRAIMSPQIMRAMDPQKAENIIRYELIYTFGGVLGWSVLGCGDMGLLASSITAKVLHNTSLLEAKECFLFSDVGKTALGCPSHSLLMHSVLQWLKESSLAGTADSATGLTFISKFLLGNPHFLILE